MIPVRCNNHPWMQAFSTSWRTRSSPSPETDGHFAIKGVPPGTYTLVAVHEKLGQQKATVTVTAPDRDGDCDLRDQTFK